MAGLRLFSSLFLEQVLIAGVIVAVGIRLSLGNWKIADLLIFTSIVAIFPFQEYFVHIYLLHGRLRS